VGAATGVFGSFVSDTLLKNVEKKYDLFAVNRFKALKALVQSLENADEIRKLEEVNDFWNGVQFRSDRELWGVSDYWATPWEFLARDAGDCEDYVIAKYFTLKYLGVDPKKMYFTYVRALRFDQPHMVLTYFETPEATPLILDNINYRIFPASQRKDLIPIYNFNGDELESYSDKRVKNMDGKSMKIKKKWDRVVENIKKEKI